MLDSNSLNPSVVETNTRQTNRFFRSRRRDVKSRSFTGYTLSSVVTLFVGDSIVTTDTIISHEVAQTES